MTNPHLTYIEVYSDGSGNSLGDDGGSGYVIVVDGVEVHSDALYIENATNNIAELGAAIEGLNYVRQAYCMSKNYRTSELHVTLISDSQLVLNYGTGAWRCKKPHLQPYRDKLQYLMNFFNADTRWVKGHVGHPQNEKCDRLAKTARYCGRDSKLEAQFTKTLIKLGVVQDTLTVTLINAKRRELRAKAMAKARQ